ncbi:hypothetical protein ADUPG1_004744, partial [Aduncisulcus paluster]
MGLSTPFSCFVRWVFAESSIPIRGVVSSELDERSPSMSTISTLPLSLCRTERDRSILIPLEEDREPEPEAEEDPELEEAEK